MTQDHLNRVTGKSHSGSVTQVVTYCYDGNGAGAGYSASPAEAYSKGRLTMTSNSKSATSILNYYQLRRVPQSQQIRASAASKRRTCALVIRYCFSLLIKCDVPTGVEVTGAFFPGPETAIEAGQPAFGFAEQHSQPGLSESGHGSA